MAGAPSGSFRGNRCRPATARTSTAAFSATKTARRRYLSRRQLGLTRFLNHQVEEAHIGGQALCGCGHRGPGTQPGGLAGQRERRPTDEQLDRADMCTLVEGQGGALLCGQFERLAGPAVVM